MNVTSTVRVISSRLQISRALLGLCTDQIGNTLTKEALARQAGEAVINFNSKMGFQGLHTVYQSNIADPVLLNAILLTLTFAVHSNPTNTKFLTYKGETLRWINERLQDPQRIAVPATIGAILLLIGVEVWSI